MAPKDESKDQLQVIYDKQSPFETNEEEECDKKNKGWKRRLVIQLREWFDVRNHNQREDDASSGYYRWAATMLLAVAAISLYRRRYRSMNSDERQRIKGRLWPLLLALFRRPAYHSSKEVSLSFLQSAALRGLVHRALVGSSEIVFQEGSSSGKWKRSRLPPNSPNVQSDLLELLSKQHADVSALPESLVSRLGTPLIAALPFAYLALMYKVLKNLHGGDMSSKLLNNHKRRQQTRFTDVAGLGPILQEVQELVLYLKNPSIYHALGAQPPRGVLLHGPPGSGKTLLAKAVAGEADCDAFLACSGSEFCEMYVGRGAARVRSLFAEARATAKRNNNHNGAISSSSSWWWSWWPTSRITPNNNNRRRRRQRRPPTAIIFIDELDALAKSRSYGGITSNDERDQTLNQLLTEMDGFPSSTTTDDDDENNVTIIIIGATNRADVLDPAILRRFDRQLHVPYPDAEGRRDILKLQARHIECNIREVDWEHLALQTGTVSGSDLKNLVNDAALLAVRSESASVTQSHFLQAIRRARAMKESCLLGMTPTNNLWLAQAK
jgi:cell division protease FtsH